MWCFDNVKCPKNIVYNNIVTVRPTSPKQYKQIWKLYGTFTRFNDNFLHIFYTLSCKKDFNE